MSDPMVMEVEKRLVAPFEASEVKWKAQAVKGNRALAVAYVDARTVQDRLDSVLGVAGWQDEYEFLPDGSALCRLRLCIGGQWITKMDVGGQSEQADEGDRKKAALSDALKRAAVKFGIGRYLYRLPSEWVDYDPQRKQLARTPTLPPSAVARPKKVRGLPADGAELESRLAKHEAALVAACRCQPGQLLAYVAQKYAVDFNVGDAAPPPFAQWGRKGIELAVAAVRAFDAACPAKPAPTNRTPTPAAAQ